MRDQALVLQHLCGTFEAARFLKHCGWPIVSVINLLARRPK